MRDVKGAVSALKKPLNKPQKYWLITYNLFKMQTSVTAELVFI